MEKKPVKIDDIAKKLNISKATVSNALSGNRYVAADTIAKVKETCREMGYNPNVVARSLRTQKTEVIGIIIPNITEPFLATIVREIEEELKKQGYHMLLGSYDFDSEEEERIIQRFLSFMVDGLIVVSGLDDHNDLYHEIAGRIPVIFMERENPYQNITSIQVDHRRVGSDAVRYLVAKGHTNIVHLTIPYENFSVIRMRVEGFLQGVEEQGLTFDDSMLMIEPEIRLNEIATSLRLAKKIKDSETTAVFVVSDYVAVGLNKGLTNLGVKVPEDISLLSVTNVDYCKVTTPTISSIDLSPRLCARRATTTMLHLIDGKKPELKTTCHEHHIIERESVAEL